MIKVVIVLLTMLVSGLSAEWRTSQKAGIKIIVPDGWITKVKGDDLDIKSPDKNVFITLNVLNEGDDLMKEAEKSFKIIEKYHTSVETTVPAQIKTLNTLSIVYSEGTGITKKGNKSADWSFAVTKNLKLVIITIMATDGAQKKYENEIKEIISSISKA